MTPQYQSNQRRVLGPGLTLRAYVPARSAPATSTAVPASKPKSTVTVSSQSVPDRGIGMPNVERYGDT